MFVLKIQNIFGKMVNRNFTPLEPQPNAKEIVTFIRYYSVLQRDRSYKRRITMFDNVQSSRNSNNAVFEYLGKYPLYTIPHRNARTPGGEYVKTGDSVKKAIVASLTHHKVPRQIYTDLVLDDLKEAPRDLRQVQNIKYSHDKEKRETNRPTDDGFKIHRKNNADDIQALFSKIHDHPFIQLLIQGKNKPTAAILYTDEQMIDLRNVCQHQNSVLGVDRTFNLGACFVTLFVYKNRNIIRKGSDGGNPIQLVPLFLHWDGESSTYHQFISHIQCQLDYTDNPLQIGSGSLLIGSDQEKSLTKAIKQCFPNSTLLLCTRHLEENTRHFLQKKVGMNDRDKKIIMDDIFGEHGLLTTKDAHSFDRTALQLDNTYLKDAPLFETYFSKKLLPQLRDNVHLPQLKNKWLPLKWTNNNCESMNHLIKLSTGWKSNRLPDLVDKLHTIVKLQLSEIRRALHNQGNYQLSPRVSFLQISETLWNTKSHAEQEALFKRFLKYHEKTQTNVITSTDGKLTIPKTSTTAKKPGSRKRPKSERTSQIKAKRPKPNK